MSLLGAVTKVKDFKMHLTLPSGLTGVVPITEVTDTLSELLASKVDDDVPSSVFPRFGHRKRCTHRRTSYARDERGLFSG